MKIFYASSRDCISPCYAYNEEDETYIDPAVVGDVFTYIELGWKEGIVTEKGKNERYCYYQIDVDTLEL